MYLSISLANPNPTPGSECNEPKPRQHLLVVGLAARAGPASAGGDSTDDDRGALGDGTIIVCVL